MRTLFSNFMVSMFVLVFGFHDSFSINLNDYTCTLYDNNKNEINDKLESTIDWLFLNNKTLDKAIKEKVCELLFFHHLFTTSDAMDCKKDGILEIPYFWHWITPNPRHEIRFKSKITMLKEIPPPLGYKKYKSYADIDRTPYIYLKNLFEDKPLFYHKDCGSFYTFGWCSEREMAFSSIVNIMGYKSKIKQHGIHVWTEILLDKSHIVSIDNTFKEFQIEKSEVNIKKWENDFGDGAQVGWYNRKVQSKMEIDRIKNIEIEEMATRRIQNQINGWLKK